MTTMQERIDAVEREAASYEAINEGDAPIHTWKIRRASTHRDTAALLRTLQEPSEALEDKMMDAYHANNPYRDSVISRVALRAAMRVFLHAITGEGE